MAKLASETREVVHMADGIAYATAENRTKPIREEFLFGKADTAALFAVSLPTLANWERNGCPVFERKPSKTTFYLPDVIDWRVSAGFTKGNAGTSAQISDKLRLGKAKAALAELQLARERSEVLPVAVVAKAWQSALAVFRQRLLSLGPLLAPQLAPAMKAIEAERIVSTSVKQALTELADVGLPADVREHLERSTRDAETAADLDGEPVGGRKA